MKETYTLKLRCTNCGQNFEHEFTKGFSVEEKGNSMSYHIIRDENDKNIECPNCGCGDTIKKILLGL
jgi:DNA-directed RNA polymerase subunit RPC12/RpoP